MTVTTQSDTPYFSRNRDQTDIAYERGWNDAVECREYMQPYQKESLARAYWAGFAAFRPLEGTTDG